MSLMLKDLMKFEIMENAIILVEEKQNETEITGITIMESPDIADWVKPGQVLITSIFSLYRCKDEQKLLISQLSQKKIAALIVKDRKSHEINDSLILECKNHRLNLIKIPEDISYTSIMYPVMKLLFNEQLDRADYFIKIHNKFTQLALSNVGIDIVLDELRNTIRRDIFLYDTNHNVEYTNHSHIKENEIIKIINNSYKKNESNLIYNISNIAYSDKAIHGISIPIRYMDKVIKYLFIENDDNHTFNQNEWIVIENVVTIINFEILKQLAVEDVIQTYKNDFLDDLLAGINISDSIIQEKSRIIGWNLNCEHIVTIYDLSGVLKLYNKEVNEINILMRYFKYKLENIVRRNTGYFTSEYIIRIRNESMILLFPYDKSQVKESSFETLVHICKTFQREVENKVPMSCVNIGIGEIALDINEISRSYNEAQEALKFGIRTYGDNSIERFENLGIYKLLCKYENKEHLENFIPLSLKKLIKYDNDTKRNLLETLEIFLRCDCNASRASQELFIHYKTLLYRMNKIKAIMGIDFISYEKKLEIDVGIKILKILDGK